MKKLCILAGASEIIEKIDPAEAFVIAADGGYAQLKAQGIEPDLVVGDFDSLGYVAKHPHVLQHPAEKDDTDMMLGIQEGLKRGYRQFQIYGGLGGRMDHSYANLQCLVYLAMHQAQGTLIQGSQRITAIHNDTICFDENKKGYLSVFAATTQAEGVTLKGLKYELENASLNVWTPLGVSNEFMGQKSEVTVKNGVLILMWQEK